MTCIKINQTLAGNGEHKVGNHYHPHLITDIKLKVRVPVINYRHNCLILTPFHYKIKCKIKSKVLSWMLHYVKDIWIHPVTLSLLLDLK